MPRPTHKRTAPSARDAAARQTRQSHTHNTAAKIPQWQLPRGPAMTWKKQCILLLPAVLAAALFCNTLPGDFVFDDVAIIRDNPTIRTLAAPGRFFTSTYWEATGRNSGLYRPLTMLTYALNYALHGLQPAGYHLLNVLLHSINTLLVTWILLRLGGSLGAACAVWPCASCATGPPVGVCRHRCAPRAAPCCPPDSADLPPTACVRCPVLPFLPARFRPYGCAVPVSPACRVRQ